jgi:hypothetical protein
MSWRISRTVSIRFAAAFLCAGLGLLLLLSMPGGAAGQHRTIGPQVFVYEVHAASLHVNEEAKYVTGSPVRWEGSAHHHDVLPDRGGDQLTPVPKRGGGVFARTDEVIDGTEKQTNSDGSTNTCSGDFSSEDNGGIEVDVQPFRGRLMTKWEIPHGFSTDKCGSENDLFPSTFISKHVVGGDLGDHRLVLTINDNARKTKQAPNITYYQELKWQGRVVLVKKRGF